MGFIESVLKDSQTMETIIIMVFGIVIWFLAMKEMLKKEDPEEGSKVVVTAKKVQKQPENTSIPLTYITKEQIMELTADQIRDISEAEVDKLPTAMKDMFKRRRNDVLLADKAKKSK